MRFEEVYSKQLNEAQVLECLREYLDTVESQFIMSSSKGVELNLESPVDASDWVYSLDDAWFEFRNGAGLPFLHKNFDRFHFKYLVFSDTDRLIDMLDKAFGRDEVTWDSVIEECGEELLVERGRILKEIGYRTSRDALSEKDEK